MSRIQASSSGAVTTSTWSPSDSRAIASSARSATTVTGSKCDTARATAAQVSRASSASASVSPRV